MSKDISNAGDIIILQKIMCGMKHAISVQEIGIKWLIVETKKCVNRMFKLRTYNLKINEEHEKTPSIQHLREYCKRRTAWEEMLNSNGRNQN